MLLSPGARLGPYEILALAGSGGMGEVYRARDSRLGRAVAVKVLPSAVADDPVRLARFEREARTTAALAHPHICTVHDTGQDGDCSYYVSEYVEGLTLQERLLRGALPLDEAMTVAEEILEALDYAHRRGVLHRDIKPSNIILAPTGVKVVDFGLAESRVSPVPGGEAAPAETMSLTGEGAFVGTVQYAAPEQLEGKPLDARTDLFAFGAVLYEMLTGTRAFPGDTPASVIAAILSRDPRPLRTMRSGVPPALDRFVSRLLAKEPDDRWQTARDAVAELRWIRSARGGSRQAWRALTRRAVWVPIAVVAGVVAVGEAALHRSTTQPAASWPATFQVFSTVPVTFTVGAPAGTTFFGNMPSMAVSPDGRYLAFLAASSGQPQELWIDDLPSGRARRVEGTRRAFSPFWSPDSRSLGFYLDGALQKIDMAGESVETITKPGESVFGAAWNVNGTVVFNGGMLKGLFSAVVGGSTPKPITTPDRSRGQLQHNWPQFLPDGRHLLFVSVNERAPATQLWVGSLDSEPPVHLLDDVTGAEYVAPGYLLFGRRGLLYAQRFDPATRSLSGDARVVVESVAFSTMNGKSVFSASSAGVLAYRSQPPDAPLAVFDTSGRHVADLGEPGQYGEPAISPDGRKVAAVKFDRALGGRDVWVLDLASGAATQFTSDSDAKSSPAWSPDGRLAFHTIHDGRFSVLVRSADQSVVDLKLDRAMNLWDWSRDGRFLAYTSLDHRRPGSATALALSAMRGDRVPWPSLPQASTASEARFSPDGHWIAYEAQESGRWEVYLSRFPSGEGKWQVSTSGGVEPRWRGDSKQLFFLAPDGSLMSADVGAGLPPASTPRRLCALPISGNRGPYSGRGPYDVTPDGRKVVLVPNEFRWANPPITVLVNWTAKLPRG